MDDVVPYLHQIDIRPRDRDGAESSGMGSSRRSSRIGCLLAAFIGSSVVVGHNVGFDRKFLEHEAAPFLGGREVRTLCTLLLARRVFPGHASYRLGHLMREVGISGPERLHRASADTWVTAHLFDRICERSRSWCGTHVFGHDLLDQLQRVKIAAARDWLLSRDRTSVQIRAAC